jgi:hypothetical protein
MVRAVAAKIDTAKVQPVMKNKVVKRGGYHDKDSRRLEQE